MMCCQINEKIIVSVIIPTYNYANFIGEAIGSVIAQTYKKLEIVIVDDGSTDNTREIVKHFIEKTKIVSISYVYQDNKGPSAARNAGIRQSSGEYVAFLDADDIWLPNKLQLQMDIISKDRSIGLITCGRYDIDKDGEVLGPFLGFKNKNRYKLLNEFFTRNVICAGGSSTLIRRKCFNELGVFDETLAVAEDWDMWLRICKIYRFESINIPLIKVRIHEGSQSYYASKNLINEFKFIDKIFSDKAFKRKWFLKRKAYSYRYYSAAIACKDVKRRSEALKYFIKSFFLFPFAFFEKTHLGTLVWIILGEKNFIKILNKKKR